MTSDELLDDVERTLRQALANVRMHLATQPVEVLRQRPHPNGWNALECLAHLNAYARDYLPPMLRAIHLAKARQWTSVSEVCYTNAGKRLLRRTAPERVFKSKRRYDFFAQSLEKETLKSFLIYTEQLLRVVQEARQVNLNRCRVVCPGCWLRRYPLGNLLEFFARHTERHVAQSMRAAGITISAAAAAEPST
ncbi:MAG: DinB family protein [Saprospiraceae bacterium]|nr:DinB family protein [Saprospiraceae bacterium]MDW8228606.1 DinB family protein [Saprospiraceae bacterium]